MGSEVHFRDLPGGPMKIKFADEITRHCLCKSCNMLSLTMYADPASHFFCETCILIQSYKHKRYDIYCPEERRNVSFEELFEARDVIMILRDQLVECPNRQNCTLKIPLEQLESHYIECMHLRSINCTKCGREVEATSWNKHKPDCKPTYDTKSTSQESNGRNNMRDHPVASQSKAQGLTSKKTGTAKHATGTSSGLYPVDQLRRMTNGDHGREPSSTETASLPPYLREKSKNIGVAESRGTASTKSAQATRQEPSLTTGCYTDWKAWKPYAASGNWYAVFVILEEQFSGTGADQAARWDHFVPKLRHTKHECIVRDLIDDPYEPQPFDCLITALIARCCLPQEVWPQGLQVTWDDIVMYVPSVLRERLTEGAKSHLRKHAVYLDSHGQPGIESSGAEAANAVVPRSPQLVASPNPATTETQAGSVKAVDVRSATQAKKQDANAISTLMQVIRLEHGGTKKKSELYVTRTKPTQPALRVIKTPQPAEPAMGVRVQYRGLPGGTHRLRFADELPRHLMCGLCGMLSLQMFEDKQGHAFCNVCIGQKSQAAAIYCGYENRDVALDEV
ncbi:hypothetical protein HPB51_006863 [Rhipicephalus microplus]|uniref:Uncharacterized protein n=1 Tax=Rhipicephalus microplus TaxID=6941 RepID=A0A9J6E7U4_RHIMP|nr:hypothetical protein HPB51_006863 [Rhipicephalus microplus]